MDLTLLKLVLVASCAAPVYYILPRRFQNLWLLLVSYAFYMSWSWQFGVFLPVFTLANYLIARQMQLKSLAGSERLLWTGISLNVLVLIFFRSQNFFLSTPALTQIFPRNWPTLSAPQDATLILVPLGLSFLVVQAISYLVDTHRRQIEAPFNVVAFALFLAYFPRIISGPIERAQSFLPRLANERIVDNTILARSFTLIVVGLVRKLLIADALVSLTPPGLFESPLDFTAWELILGLLAFAFSLYNDFAGYTSIVRGLSGLFGIELSTNFHHPYFSRNFNEFWNRWHITLSHWLRDYVFFPVSRSLRQLFPNRQHLLNIVVPPMTTMLVSGLWHGFSWHMLIWGGLHGMYQVVGRLLSLGRPVISSDRLPLWRKVASTAVVFTLAVVAWIPFRMELPVAVQFVRGVAFNWTATPLPEARAIGTIALALFLDGVQYFSDDELVFLRWPRLVQATLLAIAMLALLISVWWGSSSSFIYQNF